jgi:hypothetical protein
MDEEQARGLAVLLFDETSAALGQAFAHGCSSPGRSAASFRSGRDRSPANLRAECRSPMEASVSHWVVRTKGLLRGLHNDYGSTKPEFPCKSG